MPTEKIQSSTKGKALFAKLSNLHDISPKMVGWLEECYHFLNIFCIHILVTFKKALCKAHPLKATGSMSSFHDE